MSLQIEGDTSEDMILDVMLILKNRDEVPMASLAEGHWKGQLMTIKKGSFKIEKQIILPEILSNGDYIIDLYLHHPMVEWLLKAPHCVEIHIDGYQEGYGSALRLKDEGFIGLKTT